MTHAVQLTPGFTGRWRPRVSNTKTALFTFLFGLFTNPVKAALVLGIAGIPIFSFALALEFAELCLDLSDLYNSRNRNWRQVLTILYKLLVIGALMTAMLGSMIVGPLFVSLTAGISLLVGGLTPLLFVFALTAGAAMSFAKCGYNLYRALTATDSQLQAHYFKQARQHGVNTALFFIGALGIGFIMLNPYVLPITIVAAVATTFFGFGLIYNNLHSIKAGFNWVKGLFTNKAKTLPEENERLVTAHKVELAERSKVKPIKIAEFRQQLSTSENGVNIELATHHPASYISDTFIAHDSNTTKVKLVNLLYKYEKKVAQDQKDHKSSISWLTDRRVNARSQKRALATELKTIVETEDLPEQQRQFVNLLRELNGKRYDNAFESFFHRAGAMQTLLLMTAAHIDNKVTKQSAVEKADTETFFEQVQRIRNLHQNQHVTLIEELGEAANHQPSRLRAAH